MTRVGGVGDRAGGRPELTTKEEAGAPVVACTSSLVSVFYQEWKTKKT
jgi:hypothetical protein